jgi:hypothetical protein
MIFFGALEVSIRMCLQRLEVGAVSKLRRPARVLHQESVVHPKVLSVMRGCLDNYDKTEKSIGRLMTAPLVYPEIGFTPSHLTLLSLLFRMAFHGLSALSLFMARSL